MRLVLLAVRALLAVGQRRVHGDAVQPRADRRVAAERVELANHLQQHVLRHVLRVGVVAEHAAGDVVDARGVLAEDEFGRQFFRRSGGHSVPRGDPSP